LWPIKQFFYCSILSLIFGYLVIVYVFKVDINWGWMWRAVTPWFNKYDVAVDVETNGQKYEFKITQRIKDKIDQWLKEKNLNDYGDSKDTMYAGGTPLFNELTGKSVDRYQYLIEKYPELKNLTE